MNQLVSLLLTIKMKDLLQIISGITIIAVVLGTVHQLHGAYSKDSTQVIYDRAIYFLSKGEKKQGCKLLAEALRTTEGDEEAYEAIYEIGIRTCNWTIDPSKTYASDQ